MPTVTIDAGDARTPAPRGWNRYVIELLRALDHGAAGELTIRPVHGWPAVPEVVWEQLGLPVRARGSAVVHAPNCFLPLRRWCAGVVTVHDLAFEDHGHDFAPRTRLKYRTVTPRAVRSAERVICPSQFTAADVMARYRVAADRVRVIPLAPSLAHATAAPPHGDYLLGVGDLRAKKDFLTLVRAWRTLRDRGLRHRLVIAGADGGEGPALRTAAGREPLELTGYVTDDRLDALLRGAAALVHPSRYEGFGLVLLEAMARDTPVVAARATALPETGGDAAAYFEPGDPNDLAGILERVLGTPGDLVARGKQRVAGFTWAATARATADVYRELIA